jgi:two-component system KDP operon response regulator KdpE
VLIAPAGPTQAERIEATLRIPWPDAELRRVENGWRAIEAARDEDLDLIVLDQRVPYWPAGDALRDLRRVTSAPLVLLTRDLRRLDDLAGRSARALEYVLLPFSPIELLARCRAVLRDARRRPRLAPGRDRPCRYDDGFLAIDFARKRAWIAREPVLLTAVEIDLLGCLVANAGRVVSHRALLAWVLGGDSREATDYLWTFIRRLRARIDPDPDAPGYVVPERGIGYRFARPLRARPPRPVEAPAGARGVAAGWRIIAGPGRDRSTTSSRPACPSAAGTAPSSRRRTPRTPPGASLVVLGPADRT